MSKKKNGGGKCKKPSAQLPIGSPEWEKKRQEEEEEARRIKAAQQRSDLLDQIRGTLAGKPVDDEEPPIM